MFCKIVFNEILFNGLVGVNGVLAIEGLESIPKQFYNSCIAFNSDVNSIRGLVIFFNMNARENDLSSFCKIF